MKERIKTVIKAVVYAFKSIINKYFNPLQKTYSINIGGIDLKLFRGTYRGIDKDDAWLAFLMKDVRIFFDIGANIGWTSLLANVYGRPSRVVLVDPNAMALTLAAGNIIMNNYSSNAVFINAFISSQTGDQVKFFTVDVGAAGSMYASHAKTASSINSWYWVSSITLDDLAMKLNIVPDLIKIDVEGAEHLVLLGASRICSSNKIKVFVEMHSNRELPMAKNAEHVLKWCKDNNYKAWYLTTGEELIHADQISSRGRCHLLLLPSDCEYPAQLRTIKQGAPLPPSH